MTRGSRLLADALHDMPLSPQGRDQFARTERRTALGPVVALDPAELRREHACGLGAQNRRHVEVAIINNRWLYPLIWLSGRLR